MYSNKSHNGKERINDMPNLTPHKQPQAHEFQIDNGKPVLWIFDVQAKIEEIKDYEFIAITHPMYSEN